MLEEELAQGNRYETSLWFGVANEQEFQRDDNAFNALQKRIDEPIGELQKQLKVPNPWRYVDDRMLTVHSAVTNVW